MKMLLCSPRTLATWLRALCLSLCGSLFVGQASVRAESALILPAGGDLDAASMRSVENGVFSALKKQGFAVALQRDLAQSDAAVRQCIDLDCASQLPLGVRPSLTVALAVWQQTEPADGPLVVVTLLDQSGRYPAQAAAVQDLGDAAVQALLQAQSLRLLGPGPWVSLTGTPRGANVTIDGERVGSLPYRGALAAGSHALEVSSEGFAPVTTTLEMPLKPTHLEAQHITLTSNATPGFAGSARSSEAQHAASKSSPWNYATGAALMTFAIGLAVDPIRHAVNNGDCMGEHDAAQRCSERVVFGARSVGLAVAASALALGGAYFFVFRPIHVEVSASSHHAQAQLRLKF